MSTHTLVHLRHPLVSHAYVANEGAKRLIVFVHGFLGNSRGTWGQFAHLDEASEWWRAADLVFVSYDSVRDNITAVADRTRRYIGDFYPAPHGALLACDDAAVREQPAAAYAELIAVGHSLGGLVLRRAIVDAVQDWVDTRETPAPRRSPLVEAQLRLFSPASAGFRAAGLLGLIQAGGLWPGVELWLRQSSAYIDLQQNSPLLRDTRRRTEALRRDRDAAALPARIAWANPDNVVLSERYDTDPPSYSVDGRSHVSVCKAAPDYTVPWTFVETGSPWS